MLCILVDSFSVYKFVWIICEYAIAFYCFFGNWNSGIRPVIALYNLILVNTAGGISEILLQFTSWTETLSVIVIRVPINLHQNRMIFDGFVIKLSIIKWNHSLVIHLIIKSVHSYSATLYILTYIELMSITIVRNSCHFKVIQ